VWCLIKSRKNFSFNETNFVTSGRKVCSTDVTFTRYFMRSIDRTRNYYEAGQTFLHKSSRINIDCTQLPLTEETSFYTPGSVLSLSRSDKYLACIFTFMRHIVCVHTAQLCVAIVARKVKVNGATKQLSPSSGR
jgi:hypothetical protein